MKIIKENKNLGTLTFTCWNCGTVFSAKRGEYTQELEDDIREGKRSFFRSTNIAIPSWRISVECPSCERESIRFIPTGKPEYEYVLTNADSNF